MRKLLVISIFASLLLLLTACPSAKAPVLTLTSQDQTIKLTDSYELKGTVAFDGKVKLTYKIGTAAPQDLTVTNGKFTKVFKGSELKEGKHEITVTATATGTSPVSKKVTVTVSNTTQ